MTFHEIRVFGCLLCYASENDQWRIAVTPTIMSGRQVNVWCYRDSREAYCRYYFCGHGAFFLMDVVNAIKRILEKEHESITEQEVMAFLPGHTIENGRELRPMTANCARRSRCCRAIWITPPLSSPASWLAAW